MSFIVHDLSRTGRLTLSLWGEVGNPRRQEEIPMAVSRSAGAVEGVPRLLLRLEGAALAAGAVYMYHRLGGSWWLAACLILVPDVSLLAYFGGTRLGAIAYNAFHITLGPLVCAALGLLLPSFDLIQVALIWAAHVGIDRALGLGLKYNAGFGITHLGRIGGAMAGS
jgi:hypothetical protein